MLNASKAGYHYYIRMYVQVFLFCINRTVNVRAYCLNWNVKSTYQFRSAGMFFIMCFSDDNFPRPLSWSIILFLLAIPENIVIIPLGTLVDWLLLGT